MFLPKLVGAFLCVLPMAVAQNIPPGTSLPVMLSSSIASRSDKPGQKIDGRLMQEVLLPAGGKFKSGSHITGHVLRVERAGGAAATVTLQFDTLQDEHTTVSLNVSLRALAGSASVFQAKTPVDAASTNESSNEWVTKQVGGDVVFRGRGYVASNLGKVGTWSGTGVWGKLTPAGNCATAESSDNPQALWIFSTTACGTYGLEDLKISASGNAPPIGQITLHSSKNILVRGGSGWLLVANSAPNGAQ